MKKYSILLLLLFCAPVLASSLGAPLTYTLPEPMPKNSSPPLPVPKQPPRPPNAPVVETDEQPFIAKMDAIWGPKKIRVQHARDTQGSAVLCHVVMYNSICQANRLRIYTDLGDITIAPLDRYNPSSYVAVSGFTKYFDLQVYGNTTCKLNVSCDYVTTRLQ